MYCNSCGAQLEAGQVFCSKCGKQIVTTTVPAVSRVAQHRQLLGILWIAYSALITLVGIVLLIVFQHVLPTVLRYQPPQQQGPPPEVVFGLIRPFIHGLSVLVLAKGIAGLFAGIGLLQRAGWSRMLTLVLACISLLSFPFGTAIGVYSLWVLLSSNASAEFEFA